MRNIKKLLICTVLLLCGCISKQKDTSTVANEAYNGYYQAIIDNAKFETDSLYYSLSGEMTKLPDGTYRYYIILDQPQIAMYDVSILAVENNTHYEDAQKMMPNIGIFDSTEFNLIPFQSYAEIGFVKGIVISGESDVEPLDMKIMVEWTDKVHQNYTRQFLALSIDTENGLYDPAHLSNDKEESDVDTNTADTSEESGS